MNFALEGDGNIKIACFKQAKYSAETEAYIEGAVVFLGIIAAEALRKRAGIEALDKSQLSIFISDSLNGFCGPPANVPTYFPEPSPSSFLQKMYRSLYIARYISLIVLIKNESVNTTGVVLKKIKFPYFPLRIPHKGKIRENTYHFYLRG